MRRCRCHLERKCSVQFSSLQSDKSFWDAQESKTSRIASKRDRLRTMLDQRLLILAATLCVLAPSWSVAEKSSFFGEAATNRSVSFPAASSVEERGPANPEGRSLRQGKNLLDWLGLGVDENTDPYLARANSQCFNGDLAECFKSRALASLDDFFDKPVYSLTDHSRIVRMPGTQLRRLVKEPYEFSTEPRADEPEWDQLLKFILRKVERFVKSAAIELQFPDEVTDGGRYSPRFIDEIASEIDIIEDKKDSVFSRTRLKKLFIPMLLILKLFKLKLLLFLPLILGLASFKKFLGFIALLIPGLIGFFKLCKPDLNSSYGSFGHSSFYQPPHQQQQQFAHHPPPVHHGHGGSYYGVPYSRDSEPQPTGYREQHQSSVAFRDDATNGATFDAHDLAYQGYEQQYRKS